MKLRWCNFFIICLLILGCGKRKAQITQDQWAHILKTSTGLLGTGKLVYSQFLNEEMEFLVEATYLEVASDLDYIISDSIKELINSRKNHKITIDFSKYGDYSFISDTVGTKNRIIGISEPLRISPNLLLVTARVITSAEEEKNQVSLFYRIDDESKKLDLQMYYSWKRNMYYKSY